MDTFFFQFQEFLQLFVIASFTLLAVQADDLTKEGKREAKLCKKPLLNKIFIHFKKSDTMF